MTKQLDIGFSAAPFNLNFVDDGRIRIIARGSDVPALRDMTSRLLVVNVAGLERRKDVLKRYMAAYRETLDWMYADPAAIDAYAEWSKLPKPIAARGPEYMTRQNMEPLRISGLPGIMDDAVQFKYIPAPLSEAQLEGGAAGRRAEVNRAKHQSSSCPAIAVRRTASLRSPMCRASTPFFLAK